MASSEVAVGERAKGMNNGGYREKAILEAVIPTGAPTKDPIEVKVDYHGHVSAQVMMKVGDIELGAIVSTKVDDGRILLDQTTMTLLGGFTRGLSREEWGIAKAVVDRAWAEFDKKVRGVTEKKP